MTRDGPIVLVLLSVGLGAALGAMIRWGLSYALNTRLEWLPLGTLVANLAAGILIGLVLAWLTATPSISPLVRLFLVTGFLGGLSTLSTFSAEAINLLMLGHYMHALEHIALHLLGTLALTGVGLWIGRRLFA